MRFESLRYGYPLFLSSVLIIIGVGNLGIIPFSTKDRSTIHKFHIAHQSSNTPLQHAYTTTSLQVLEQPASTLPISRSFAGHFLYRAPSAVDLDIAPVPEAWL